MVYGENGRLGVLAVKLVVQVEHKQDNELVIILHQNMEESIAMENRLVLNPVMKYLVQVSKIILF